jgi:flavodoxin I
MSKTVVVFGSSTGTCEGIANKIGEKLGAEVVNVSDMNEDILAVDNLIIGTSTWGAGELQDDWYEGVELLKSNDLSGKVVAIFGCGDCESYSDTFCGAMAELYNAAKSAGATLVGAVSTDGYSFDDSEAVVDGQFVGLALDDINEDDKTDGRIDAWITQIQPSLK